MSGLNKEGAGEWHRNFGELVDRQGASVNRKTIFAALWEDGLYDRSKRKYLDVIIRCLRDTLREHGVSSILEIKKECSGYALKSWNVMYTAFLRVI